MFCFTVYAVLCLVAQSCPTLCHPTDCSPPGFSVHGDSPVKNTGVGCHALLQRIFPTQGSNPGLPHCRWIFYCVSQQGSPGRPSKSQISRLGQQTRDPRKTWRLTGRIPSCSGKISFFLCSCLTWGLPTLRRTICFTLNPLIRMLIPFPKHPHRNIRITFDQIIWPAQHSQIDIKLTITVPFTL